MAVLPATDQKPAKVPGLPKTKMMALSSSTFYFEVQSQQQPTTDEALICQDLCAREREQQPPSPSELPYQQGPCLLSMHFCEIPTALPTPLRIEQRAA
jgi:hypothetical protein